MRINKFLELKVVVHGGLWVEGRERVCVKREEEKEHEKKKLKSKKKNNLIRLCLF